MRVDTRKQTWRARIARLRRDALTGNIAAVGELGLLLQQGIQDERGRAIVRRAPGAGFRLLLRAAAAGDTSSALPLGYAHDVGLGTRRDKRQALRWYRRAWSSGDASAASNIATVHRDDGELRRAFEWWSRGARVGDGDAALEVGYCYQYGIGTRSSRRRACRMYERAMASKWITACGREEAMYHMAVAYLDEGNARRARPLLARAAADGDFPEAESLLAQLRAEGPIVPCRCRRGVRASHAERPACPRHPDGKPSHPHLQRSMRARRRIARRG